MSSKYNRLGCVKALFELKANFQVRSTLDNFSPYDVAMWHNNNKICTYLMGLAKEMTYPTTKRRRAQRNGMGKENSVNSSS